MTKNLRFSAIAAVILLMTLMRASCHLILNGTAAVEPRGNREGRYLIFNRGGNVRMITGFLFPLFIPKWQNINCLNNWSIGFNVPTLATDWTAKLRGSPNWQNRRDSRMITGDDTRERFYKFLERSFGNHGRNGHECVLRMICQVAEAPIAHNGLIGELFHVVFTPGDGELLNEDYKAARKAGTHGLNCDELYPGCPFGHSPLDKFSVLGMMTPTKILDAFRG